MSHRPCRNGRASRARVLRFVLALLAFFVAPRLAAQPQGGAQDQEALPTIEEKTEGMRSIPGFLPMYWEESTGKLWMEVERFDTEFLNLTGLAAGLGSNDIGLDRGQTQGSRIVHFERRGPKVLLVKPNYQYRATSDNAAEVRAVKDAFARSVLWGFTVAAETDGRVLIDLSDYLVRDATNMAQRLRPGSYRFDAGRSSIFLPMVQNFPENTEMEVELTFVQQPGQGGGGPGGGGEGGNALEGVSQVAASSEAASLRLHQSFVALPDSGYTPRAYDPRSGYNDTTWEDYAVPLGEPMTARFISRHRIEKRDPSAAVSDPVEPIVYYLDPGAPEPIRTALLEGARWWNQAFEAAGFRNGFRVEMRPDSISPLDIRYHVINWVHRSTRGWSYGASVTDPRTGEIIKGVVTLGSLRVRQDYMLAEGLLAPYQTGTENPPELSEWALARIRQLSAHEVGHTLGLAHNYYNSSAGRISVLDYPHPLVTLNQDGTLDHSQVYENGIGEWDSVAIRWGYGHFADGVDETVELKRILDEASQRNIRFLTNQDIAVTPHADQWANGTDQAAELNRMMEVRRVALSRFGERAIRRDRPMATIEEVLVPLYLHHRYQAEATASALGGLHFLYTSRGDGSESPYQRVPAEEQRAALDALLATLEPSALALPREVLALIPPRPMGYGRTRELFPRWTGQAFDAVSPAAVAADMVVSNILSPARAARLVEQAALDPSLPGLDEVIERLVSVTFGETPRDPYEAEIARVVQRSVTEGLIELASGPAMPQVRALASHALRRQREALQGALNESADGAAAHASLLAADIERFLERPAEPYTLPTTPDAPPGAPIGDTGLNWLDLLEPPCSWQ